VYKQRSEFDETRIEVLHALMAANPLGAVVSFADVLTADHIPFEIGAPTEAAPFGVLRAHVARANPMWTLAGREVLTIFQGASGYISPELYEDKPIHGKVVPTWNYAVVHAHGELRAIEDPAWVFALLERLTDAHEAGRTMPWSIHDAPRDFIDKIMTFIVGIEIPIARIQGKWKMSQNRSASEQVAIAADVPALAGFMRA
jgi:transcriptional regulator